MAAVTLQVIADHLLPIELLEQPVAEARHRL